MIKRARKIITFFLLLNIFISVSFGNIENGYFVEFGQDVKAASINSVNFRINNYSDKICDYWEYGNPPYPVDVVGSLRANLTGKITAAITGNNNQVYFSVKAIAGDYSTDYYNTGLRTGINSGTTIKIKVFDSTGYQLSECYLYFNNPTPNTGTLYSLNHDDISGTVSLPYSIPHGTRLIFSADISVWVGDSKYFGEVYTPYNEFEYVWNDPPTIISTIKGNGTLSKLNNFTPSMTVSDPDGDTLTCKYYIDSVWKETKAISNTATPQLVNFNALDISTLTDGKHTFKFEVSDGIYDPVTKSVDVIVDNSPPILGTVNITADATSMNITGSATDTVSDAASIQYRYTVGSTVSNWVNNTSYTIGSLTPNTVYYVKYEARDKAGNVSFVERNIRTKAQVPQISFNNNKENSLDLSINDSNPAVTQYQISTGSRYVNASGILTSSPEWITVPGKEITVTGLTENTQYNFAIKAKNDEGIETTATQKAGTTLALPPKVNVDKKGITYITLKWEAVSGATGYEIEADGKISSNGTATTYTQNGLEAETSHTYRLRVINAGGTGRWSEVVQAATYPNPPETPVITETYTTQSAITINWDEVDKATGYEIEADGKIISTDLETTYTDEGLQPDTSHKYRVRAGNDGGSSEWSAYTEISTLPNPPEIPGNLTGRPAMKNITLTWEVPDRAEGYELEIDGRILQVETNTYIHEGLSTNTSHKYRIRAYNKGGKSQWSEPVTVTTWPDIPFVPKNIMATAEQNSITLTWYSSPYAESYDLQVDEKTTVNTKGMSYTNENLTSGTEHSYKIRAVNISGNGEWSNPIEISTLPQEESSSTTGAAIIANLAAVVTNKTVIIAWQAVEVNAQYDIEVDGVVFDNGKDTVFNHTGLKAETFHTYRVRTKNVNGNGQWCAVLALSTLPDLPGAPSNVNVTVTDTQVQLTWTKEEGISYEVEADGESINVGQVSNYTDENLAPGTSHTYRVRGKNITGVTAWSDSIMKSTTSPSYELECTKDQEFDFSLLAANVQDFGDITFVVTYNPDELEVVDLCEFKAGKDTATGAISGTNISVTVKEGRIEYRVNESINPGTAWSGEISAMVFKAKVDGKVQINFTIE
ncbi:fibronectin type III domain-containing protein [Ruminiclostridium cellobioparum]|uniref:Fibronectin type III domain-containing protein n=1 Tax=Ruminiclostridium cellobioparum subsp. termitidis CT1112 TaxID=1195236 RepID=S0FGD0_RUMCE|nr:fibronectin type III domain-containing protein [Ruminiclostridium cellobioparum]EMS70435.1 fibronectin type III domain-containing protein [Ruminiclostridium cellobioparum subsp. termitidis CT1112]